VVNRFVVLICAVCFFVKVVEASDLTSLKSKILTGRLKLEDVYLLGIDESKLILGAYTGENFRKFETIPNDIVSKLDEDQRRLIEAERAWLMFSKTKEKTYIIKAIAIWRDLFYTGKSLLVRCVASTKLLETLSEIGDELSLPFEWRKVMAELVGFASENASVYPKLASVLVKYYFMLGQLDKGKKYLDFVPERDYFLLKAYYYLKVGNVKAYLSTLKAIGGF